MKIAKSPKLAKLLTTLRNRSSLGVLIPDYIGITGINKQREAELLEFADYYLVTNQELFEIYSNRDDCKNPAGVLHDIPNLQLIQELRGLTLQRDTRRAIWVGNSKWGRRQGFHDHKGFLQVVKPLEKIIEKHNNCFNLQVIDSSKLRVPQRKVLELIGESSYILQTSYSEGTGLPVLEGMALGTIPISTSVGIVPEVLKGSLSRNIISNSPESFHDALHLNFESPAATPLRIREIFETYTSEALTESIFNGDKVRHSPGDGFSMIKSIKSQLEWNYRFWKYH